MELNEEQSDELEAMNAIFEDDEFYKQEIIDDRLKFTYKFEHDNHNYSFILQMTCPKDYPEVPPEFCLDIFFNNHLQAPVKAEIVEKLTELCEDLKGEAMIYSIIDHVKENQEELMSKQNEVFKEAKKEEVKEVKELPVAKQKEKKEQLTKAQKRKLADRVNTQGERPRGWDWIDCIKHLSQTGGKHENT